MADSQHYMYQLTINNPIEKGYTHNKIKEIFRNQFKTTIYYAMSDEEGSCHHTHIFVVFSSRVRVSMVKKYFNEAHIEVCRGRVSDNINYIKKSGKWELDESKQEKKIEGTFEEVGTAPPDSKGRRSDMSDLYQMVSDGLTNAEILAINQDYILQIDKLDRIRNTLLSEKYKNTVRLSLKSEYIFGASGTGKTRGIIEKHGFNNVYRVTDYNHPFDSYNNQNIIVFEEFRSSLRISDMLNYLDIYPLELPCRYVNRVACYEQVYIVSNWELEKQYKNSQDEDYETWKAFLRRIHKVSFYKENGDIVEYDSVNDYFNSKK